MSSCLADEAILLYLQDLAPVATLLFDRAERVVSANAHAVAVIGRNPAGLRPREVFVDFSGTLSLEDMLRDPSQTYLLHIDRSPGLPRTLQFRARRIADQILLLGDHDPTEQERLQEQIFSLNQELTNLTRGLQKSNAELVRLNQLKNQMLGMAAHDLRGPLGVIMSYGEFSPRNWRSPSNSASFSRGS
jgi:signal transduction histidine kinase